MPPAALPLRQHEDASGPRGSRPKLPFDVEMPEDDRRALPVQVALGVSTNDGFRKLQLHVAVGRAHAPLDGFGDREAADAWDGRVDPPGRGRSGGAPPEAVLQIAR